MLEEMQCKGCELVALKYHGSGWPGFAEAEYQDGRVTKKASLTYEESWGNILQKYRQWRCYVCPDHTGEYADIAVVDPWR